MHRLSVKFNLLLLTIIPLLALAMLAIYEGKQISYAADEIESISNLYTQKIENISVPYNYDDIIKNSVVQLENLEQSTLLNSTVLTLVTIIMALMINIIITRKIISRINYAAEVADLISGGHRDVEVENSGHDEISRLLQSLHHMQTNIRNTERILHEGEEKLRSQQSELEHLTKIDALTGVYNRRHLSEKIENEISRNNRYCANISVMMVDLDHFKNINDTYGHAAGDQILKIVSKLFKHSIRETDMVARYGGEEFCIILVETPLDEAMFVAEKIRAIIEEATLPMGDNQVIDVTCSIGVAQYHRSMRNSETLIAKADEALYRAKREGRNRVVMCLPPKEHKLNIVK